MTQTDELFQSSSNCPFPGGSVTPALEQHGISVAVADVLTTFFPTAPGLEQSPDHLDTDGSAHQPDAAAGLPAVQLRRTVVYWSHRLSTWADLWTPDGNVQPQYDVAWRRFQGEQTNEFIAWQADLVREYAAPEQFVTTCISYERPAIDDERVSEPLDVAAGNPYYAMQDGLELPDDRHLWQGWKTTGTWALFESADRMFASRQDRFLVTETNASSIGFPWDNRPAYDGQWRQAAWALISRGARMVEYWQWHSLLFGAETYWGGVLPHSGEPGRTYRELARLGSELATIGDRLAGFVPDADVTILYSTPSKWLIAPAPATTSTLTIGPISRTTETAAPAPARSIAPIW